MTERKSLTPGVVFCSLIAIVASIVIANRDNSPLKELQSKTFAANKPYATFDQFYPHYLREHSQVSTRQWHYVGTSLFLLYIVTQPSLILSILTAGLAGYSVVPFLRHLPTGLPEMTIFAFVYLLGGRLLTHSWKRTLIPMFLGYGFAWIGHFFFEHNKPATFIYPSYSLFGDFRMIYDAIRNQRF